MNQNCLNLKAKYSELIVLQQKLILAMSNKDNKLGKRLEKQIRDIIKTVKELADPYLEQKQEFQDFYKELGIEDNLDFLDVKIPDKTEEEKEFTRLLIIPQGLIIQQVFDICTKVFEGRTYKWTDNSLDVEVAKNDRTTNQSYAIWLRDTREADEVNAGKSANQLKEEKIKGITLLERLILEIKYFKETNQHLDIKWETLCSGSRRSGGGVPGVGWRSDGDELSVYWFGPGVAGGSLRSRQVVS